MGQRTWSDKRERQYEHIKGGLEERGRAADEAEEIAARTVSKSARAGESDTASRSSVEDISSGRRGGLRSHRGSGGPTTTSSTTRPAKRNDAGPIRLAEGGAGM